MGGCFFVFPLCGFSLSLFCNSLDPVLVAAVGWLADTRYAPIGVLKHDHGDLAPASQ